jgi:serine/threonine-protein kinase Chk1
MDVCSDTQVGNWEFANTLGEGAYGEVKLAINNKNQETRAVKIISLNLLNDKTAIQKEVLIHKTLNHDNVIKYYSSFQQLDKFYIILEYASGGELFDRIEPDFGMHVDLAHKYFCQLINGVEYLHSKGIVHRDLKPENLLLNDNDLIKIADFGLATLFQYKGNERLLTSPCGTAPYVAPEVLCKSEYKAQPTDVWSTGIVLVAMLAGELPWDKPILECGDYVSWVKNNYQKTPWCKIENTALSLMRNILNFDPSERFTIKQIKASTWFVRTFKNSPYGQTVSSLNENDNSYGFLSQPAYIYFNESSSSTSPATTTASFLSNMATELEVTDSQQNCECSAEIPALQPLANNTNQHHFESFSQPINIADMFLNSQINGATQSQFNPSQFGSQFQAASQSPLLKLVKRMTRMFVHSNVAGATEELGKVFHKFMYEFKVSVTNQRQRQITVSTSDKRQTLLTFKVNIIEMPNCQNEVLVDFRLSKGDGLEFKKFFMKIKASLAHIVCKRYVFKNSHGCCDKKQVK